MRHHKEELQMFKASNQFQGLEDDDEIEDEEDIPRKGYG